MLSVSMHSRRGAFYAVTDQAAVRGGLDLVVMTRAQFDEALANDVAGEVTRDVRAYLREVVRAYPTARVVVVTPTGHDEDAWPVHPRSCAREVPAIVRAAARKLGLHVIDGTRLIERGDVVLSDGEHPSAAGHVQMAARLAVMLEGGA